MVEDSPSIEQEPSLHPLQYAYQHGLLSAGGPEPYMSAGYDSSAGQGSEHQQNGDEEMEL